MAWGGLIPEPLFPHVLCRAPLAFCLVLLLLLPLSLFAQEPAAPTIAETIDSLAASRKIDKARAGWQVIRLSDGAEVAAREAHAARQPASNAKLFTTAAALVTLGRDYRFETFLLRRGPVADGVLMGDLIVVGSGDPNISARFHDGNPTFVFEQWAADLRKAGIQRIRGNLVCDDTLFDRQWVHPTWPEDQLHEWYAAEVGALSLNDNCLDVTVQPGKGKGRAARVFGLPNTGYALIVNKTGRTISKKYHRIVLARAPGANTITVTGKVWGEAAPFTAPITLHDPTMFFGQVLKETFARGGISVDGPVVRSDTGLEKTDPACVVVAKWSSPIDVTLQVANQRSQNLYAECLAKLLGAKSRQAGTWANGGAAIAEAVAKLGCVPGEVVLVDGSGLSHDDRATPAAACALLLAMAKRPDAEVFLNSLAVSGAGGSLEDRLDKAPWKGAVRAKTGTINGVSCLSGYVYRGESPVFAFSMMVNGWKGGTSPVKDFEDEVCKTLIEVAQRNP